MADFISGFWNMYVMVLVALSILFCVFVLASNMTKREKGPVQLHGHVWDETLAEYNNPLPRWWMYLFWITIVFAVVYLAIYPALAAATRAAVSGRSTMRRCRPPRSVSVPCSPSIARWT